MADILDGRLARTVLASRLKERLKKISPLCLAIIQIGEENESNSYIKQKIKFGQEVGVKVLHIKFGTEVSKKEILLEIKRLNEDKKINGIIVQLPIPDSLPRREIIDAIFQEKDVDGLTSFSVENRKKGIKSFWPATARGIVELMEFYKIPISGKKVVVLGRSIIAGGPIAEIITARGGLVSVCHSKTPLDEEIEIVRNSDILIVAIGRPKFIDRKFFRSGAGQIVIDVGLNKIFNPRSNQKENNLIGVKKNFSPEIAIGEQTRSFISGDVDFEGVFPLVGAISPVPGGVGQMTVLALFENLADSSSIKEA